MVFEIEIGTEEQKKMIEQEFDLIKRIADECQPPINLLKIIVPWDFEAKINEIEGVDTYRSVRGLGLSCITANARITKINDGYAIILSSNNYSDANDTQTRCFTLLHELHHIINKQDFPEIPNDSYVKAQYLYNLYNIYDEYSSDRFAYSVVEDIFSKESEYWKNSINDQIVGFTSIINDPIYYTSIRREIKSFRTHADIHLFFRNIREYFDELFISIAHIFSLFHQYTDKISRSKLLESPFINEKCFNLMEYLKNKHEKKDNNLFDGNELIIEFMTNFGVKFEHRDYGGYCHVLDI